MEVRKPKKLHDASLPMAQTCCDVSAGTNKGDRIICVEKLISQKAMEPRILRKLALW